MCRAVILGALLAYAPGAAGPAPAQEARPPLELTTFPRTSLEITYHEDHHAVRLLRQSARCWNGHVG
jgi:hypothetical protein